MTSIEAIPLPPPDVATFDRIGTAESASLGFEKQAGQFDNKVPIAWFVKGYRESRAVARVITPSGLGTGWLINGGFLITNNHVIGSKAAALSSRVQFNFEDDSSGTPQVPESFEIDEFVATDVGLDYTIVKPTGDPERKYGFFDIRDAVRPLPGDVNTQFPVIFQHPGGRKKEFSGFENELARTNGPLVWYTSDTEPGSSGSPVLGGKDFRPFALHHAGGPHFINGQSVILNEGILLTSIVEDLLDNHPGVAAQLGLRTVETLLDDAVVRWLGRGRLAGYVNAVLRDDEELQRTELNKLHNSFRGVGGVAGAFDDSVGLQTSINRLALSRDREIVPVLVAAAGVAAGAGVAHWAHITSRERLSGGNGFSPLAPSTFDLDFGPTLTPGIVEGFSLSAGGSLPLVNFGVSVSAESLPSAGGGTLVETNDGFKVEVAGATNLDNLYRGVRRLFSPNGAHRQFFATIQPQTEALPVLAAVFLAGVGAGASAYQAGR